MVKSQYISGSTNPLASYISGIEGEIEGVYFYFRFDNDFLYLHSLKMGTFRNEVIKTYRIPVKNIITMQIINKSNIEQVNTSISRGIVGGMLFGEAGLLLGGMSGIGTKQEKLQNLFCISYSTGNDQTQTMIFNADAKPQGRSETTLGGLKRFIKSFDKEHAQTRQSELLNTPTDLCASTSAVQDSKNQAFLIPKKEKRKIFLVAILVLCIIASTISVIFMCAVAPYETENKIITQNDGISTRIYTVEAKTNDREKLIKDAKNRPGASGDIKRVYYYWKGYAPKNWSEKDEPNLNPLSEGRIMVYEEDKQGNEYVWDSTMSKKEQLPSE